jgi:GNAT superfamily N-acetyltransferase
VVATVRIIDVTDASGFALIPPCADPSFDHRTCDYWEDADRGSKAARPSWLEPVKPPPPARRAPTGNPFLDDAAAAGFNPFATGAKEPPFNPFASGDDSLADNPFAPTPAARPTGPAGGPRKLELLTRGLAVAGSYAKVLLVDDLAVAWTQFGPLSAYARAMRLRELYPQLPEAPLPAVITCIATTRDARRQGHAFRLVEAVVDDLASRGFAAVEAYPEKGVREDETSAATPAFWRIARFDVAVDDERYPVMRRDL